MVDFLATAIKARKGKGTEGTGAQDTRAQEDEGRRQETGDRIQETADRRGTMDEGRGTKERQIRNPKQIRNSNVRMTQTRFFAGEGAICPMTAL